MSAGPVTEFALLPLSKRADESFTELAERLQRVQDEWTLARSPSPSHFGDKLSTRAARGVAWYIAHSRSSPSSQSSSSSTAAAFAPLAEVSAVFITALWDSVDAHGEWLASLENRDAMADLGSWLASTTGGWFFHLDAIVFAATVEEEEGRQNHGPEMRTRMRKCKHISAFRFVFPAGKKAEVDKVCGEALGRERFTSRRSGSPEDAEEGEEEEGRHVEVPPLAFGSGWRVEEREDGRGEFVMFAGWRGEEMPQENKRTEEWRGVMRKLENMADECGGWDMFRIVE